MIPGRVSIIMPCYNAAKYVDEAIQSLRAQTYSNFEILAVDDGSTDDTRLHLERNAATDPRVRVFLQKNGGPSAARNTAMRQIQGEYACFLDADDVFLPDKLESQVRFLAEHLKVDLVYADYYTGDSHLNLTGLTAVRIAQTDMLEAFAMRNWFPPLVPMFRCSRMEAVGEFDESFPLAEDWDYWIRWAKVGTFAYLAGPKVIYRTHDDQAHHNLDRMFGYGKRMLRKHFKSDPARYQRALASWYALHAKARWATARHVKTGVFLACSAFHRRMADVATIFAPSA